jgi:mannose-6-phosphate isomerase-like protein (cupin superfamily)
MNKVNLEAKLLTFDALFSPKTVARMNDYKIAVVKTKGEFVWHKHDDTDDFFLVLKGCLHIQLRDHEDIVLKPGELFVVPKGMEHCPRADQETHVLLIEPMGTINTGDAGGELTAKEEMI